MKNDAALKAGEAKDAAAVVHRQLTLEDGSTLAYTATTGHLVTEGSKKATIFYAAYTPSTPRAKRGKPVVG
jgi:carboxypeptidase C (cathepsin A)